MRCFLLLHILQIPMNVITMSYGLATLQKFLSVSSFQVYTELIDPLAISTISGDHKTIVGLYGVKC